MLKLSESYVAQVTEENPHILISKAKIMEDFKMRAAVCDFHPIKKQVQ